MLNGSVIQQLYEYSYVLGRHALGFYLPTTDIIIIRFNKHSPLQYPQQETSQIPDSMTVVFPWRDWKCSVKDNRYFPAVFSIQETGQNKPMN